MRGAKLFPKSVTVPVVRPGRSRAGVSPRAACLTHYWGQHHPALWWHASIGSMHSRLVKTGVWVIAIRGGLHVPDPRVGLR